MHRYRLLLVESVAVDSLADVVAGLPDDLAALRLRRRINFRAGVASGEEGLLLHDCGPGLLHHQACDGPAGDDTHSGANSLPNSSAHTPANSGARSSATPSTDANAASRDAGTRTSRPLQLRCGHVDELGSREEDMVLHQSSHLRRQPDPSSSTS